MTAPHSLTEADVLTLRVRMKGLTVRTPPDFRSATPFLVFSVADSEYFLHAGGNLVAVTPDPLIATTLLRNERHEPGYVVRILSATEPPDFALLSPEARAEKEAQRRAAQAYATQARLEAEERAAQLRRIHPIDKKVTPTLDLDDLLS